jgi:hypothetical protein
VNNLKYFFLPVILLAAHSLAQTVDVTTGNSLFHECQGAIRMLNGSYDPSDGLDGQYCAGYIDGLTQGMEGRKEFCIDTFRTSTLARIYVTFIQKNPKYLDQPKAYGVIASLTEAYPCKQK